MHVVLSGITEVKLLKKNYQFLLVRMFWGVLTENGPKHAFILF